MFVIYVLVFMMSLLGAYQLTNQQIADAYSAPSIKAEAFATNFIYYTNLVKTYVAANPTATGTLTDSTLNLPSWYRNMAWTNSVSTNFIYIYSANNSAASGLTELPAYLIDKTDGSFLVGIKKAGAFYHPSYGVNSSIALPTSIPDNSPVYVIARN